MQSDSEDNLPIVLDRDIILVVGQNCVGKTKTCTTLAAQLSANGVHCVAPALSDAQFLMQRVALDDHSGGYGHYHP